MNLHRLDKTLDKYQSILGDNNSISNNNNINPELEQAKAFLAQRRELYLKAHKKRMDNWFAAHPDKQYFEESYKEFVRDCEFDEWYWYLIERLQDSPEQRYQQMKNKIYGFGHDGIDKLGRSTDDLILRSRYLFHSNVHEFYFLFNKWKLYLF